MKSIVLFAVFLLTLGFTVPHAEAQSLPEPRQSPLGLSRTMLGDTYVKVIYGRPYVRDRQIFGSLVPYGEVWRTGANESTEITLTGDVFFDSTPLPAGTYSVFTVPGPDEWTVILNSQLGLWGSYAYNSAFDVLRTRVPVKRTADKSEIFTISLDKQDEENVLLIMEWERTRVELPIRK
ncbi:MAG: DUF2911 domain-containing protein [Candidatus Cyclonatronum sp.]|uniref:DUF2911 domain-containing protein n=1 Tax=Cyclonatronum sp. TaxID=3024185 RepID=UPI0025C0716C|nr:DUF2911 domain-containing protein [Cyclonatronum sp.]MCC5934090.1 DUF2911 domain-containing protein [Balneolales bacterium]MCH8488239.1 DUF2911 domain-containing protein [Cyclonatronum sp.]